MIKKLDDKNNKMFNKIKYKSQMDKKMIQVEKKKLIFKFKTYKINSL